MFAKISYTWDLMRASWTVLKVGQDAAAISNLSGLCCIALLASLRCGFSDGCVGTPGARGEPDGFVVYYGLLFLFYIANFFVITFFNTAIVSCAMLRRAVGIRRSGRLSRSRISIAANPGWRPSCRRRSG